MRGKWKIQHEDGACAFRWSPAQTAQTPQRAQTPPPTPTPPPWPQTPTAVRPTPPALPEQASRCTQAPSPSWSPSSWQPLLSCSATVEDTPPPPPPDLPTQVQPHSSFTSLHRDHKTNNGWTPQPSLSSLK